MIIREFENSKIVVIATIVSDSDFLKANPTGGFTSIDTLPPSRYGNYKKYKDAIVIDEELELAAYKMQYSIDRQQAYNALNQFELISDDSINGTTTHKDAILAIKAEFPKP